MFIFIVIGLFTITETIRYIYSYRSQNKQKKLYLTLTYISAILTPLLTVSILINHFIIQRALFASTSIISFLVFLLILVGLEIFNLVEIKGRIKEKDGVEKL